MSTSGWRFAVLRLKPRMTSKQFPAARFASKFDSARNRGRAPRNQQDPVPAFEILPSSRTHSRELRQSNPEIRRSLGFFPVVVPAPSPCLASNAPNHSQKQRRILALSCWVMCSVSVFKAQRRLLESFFFRKSQASMMSAKTTQPRPGGAFWKDDQWRILLFSHNDVGLVFCYYEII